MLYIEDTQQLYNDEILYSISKIDIFLMEDDILSNISHFKNDIIVGKQSGRFSNMFVHTINFMNNKLEIEEPDGIGLDIVYICYYYYLVNRTIMYLFLDSIQHTEIDSMNAFGVLLNSNHYIDTYPKLNKTNIEGNNTIIIYNGTFEINGTSLPTFSESDVMICNLSVSNGEYISSKKYYTILFILTNINDSDESKMIGILAALDEMNLKTDDSYYVYIYIVIL